MIFLPQSCNLRPVRAYNTKAGIAMKPIASQTYLGAPVLHLASKNLRRASRAVGLREVTEIQDLGRLARRQV